MALEEKIVEWAASRPNWQRLILWRIGEGKPLSETEYDKLVEDLVAGNAIEELTIGPEHVPSQEHRGVPVQLISIGDPKHINALSSPKPLTFGEAGLTVVYGENGSGKSGYARVLKRIARAPHQEPVHSNAFTDSGSEDQSVRLRFKVGGEPIDPVWSGADILTPPAPETASMLFYDGPTGLTYIDRELKFPYTPPGINVMKGLRTGCDAIDSRVAARIRENQQRVWQPASVDERLKDSTAAQFLAGLLKNSTTEELDNLIAQHDAVHLTTLRERLKALRLEDPSSDKARQESNAKELDALASHVEGTETPIGAEAVDALRAAYSEYSVRFEAAELAAEHFRFDAEHLTGVGTDPWKELWKSARRFSEQHAYPEQDFPVTGEDARCVLCLQELKEEGANERLIRFERFVQEGAQKQLGVSLGKLNTLHTEFEDHACLSESVQTRIDVLLHSYPALIGELTRTLTDFESSQAAVLKAIEEESEIPVPSVSAGDLASRLRRAAEAARDTAKALGKPEGLDEGIRKTELEIAEQELLHTLAEVRESIVQEINRLKELDALGKLQREANTQALSNKIRELAAQQITDKVTETFQAELDALKAPAVEMELTRVDKTHVLHRSRLKDATQALRVGEVFSEGENSVLGLAGFLTTVALDQSKSAVIFDDPVSSLDHVRRPRVAERLARLAKDRQVVVFTHDIAFVVDLRMAAEYEDVDFTPRTLCRTRCEKNTPGNCVRGLPWDASGAKERLKKLAKKLAAFHGRDRTTWAEDERAREIKSWAGELSEVWEDLVDQECLWKILGEGGVEVRPKMVKVMALFEPEYGREFTKGYSTVTNWAQRHRKSPRVNFTLPELDELQKEHKRAIHWFAHIRKCQGRPLRNKELAELGASTFNKRTN